MEQDHKLGEQNLEAQKEPTERDNTQLSSENENVQKEQQSEDSPKEMNGEVEVIAEGTEPVAASIDEAQQGDDPTEDAEEELDQQAIEEELLEEMRDKGISKLVVDIFEWVETLVMAVVCVVLLFTLVARTSQVIGVSMVPTLHEKDMLMVSRLLYQPHYGDIVVITKPNYLHEPIIKRVIATEGQEVNIDFEQGVVFVNGIALDEQYINEPTHRSYDVSFPLIVPKGQVFVLGDNRNHSLDSRATDIGLIDQNYILGKAFMRFLPFASFGGLYS